MSFSLDLDRPFADSIHRIGLSQIDRALMVLTPQEGGEPGVHQARRSFKRFRALMHFAKPGFSKRDFKEFNQRVREIASRFSTTRDRQVMTETLIKIEASAEAKAARQAAQRAKQLLQEKGDESQRQMDETKLALAIEDLHRLRLDFEKVNITLESFADLTKGMCTVYRGCRIGQTTAEHSATDEDYHDWRKHVQRHWRHLQLIRRAWPGIIRVHIAEARELSQILGEDHDLAVLRYFIEANRKRLGPKSDQQALIAECIKRQAQLRRAAHVSGLRLFADKPKALMHRFSVYWEMGKELAAINAASSAPHSNAQILHLVQ